MPNHNVVVIEGNMTRDPEIRETGKSQVANFGIAVNKRIRVDGEWKNGDPQFYEVQAWGYDAECAMQLSKGEPVIVIGELNFSTFEKDGAKRTQIRITARSLGRKLRRMEGAASSSSADSDEVPF